MLLPGAHEPSHLPGAGVLAQSGSQIILGVECGGVPRHSVGCDVCVCGARVGDKQGGGIELGGIGRS